VLSGLWYWAYRPGFNLQLTVSSQPGAFQGIPRKSLNFKPTPKTLRNQKNQAKVSFSC
jgi:hypothetical protein